MWGEDLGEREGGRKVYIRKQRVSQSFKTETKTLECRPFKTETKILRVQAVQNRNRDTRVQAVAVQNRKQKGLGCEAVKREVARDVRSMSCAAGSTLNRAGPKEPAATSFLGGFCFVTHQAARWQSEFRNVRAIFQQPDQ